MSRELKRVPLDFDWPLNKTWRGFVNPYSDLSTTCGACDGTGYGPVARVLYGQWYGNELFRPDAPLTPEHKAVRAYAERQCERAADFYGSGEDAIQREARRLCALFNVQWSHHLDAEDVAALIAADRLWDFTRIPRTKEQREVIRKKVAAGENSWLPESNGYIPTPEEVNAWAISGLGHDSINAGVCIKDKCKRLGHEVYCPSCDGEGVLWGSLAAKSAYENWREEEPPAGEGFQLWQDTSEGSPVSPVFVTIDALCLWAETNATVFADHKASAAKWKEMLERDFVCHEEGDVIFL